MLQGHLQKWAYVAKLVFVIRIDATDLEGDKQPVK
jgi:hypothetical protein